MSGVLGTAGPAAAAGDTITVVSVGSPDSSIGALSVTLDSSASISAMTAHVINSATADVLDPPMTLSGNQVPLATGQYQSTSTVTTPVTEGTPPAGIPLGTYTVGLDVTFADNTTTTFPSAGTFSFTGAPQITISANHTDVTFADPTVTITGQATLVAPDGTTSAWNPSVPLVLTAPWLSGAHVTVQPGGGFTVVTSPRGASPAPFFVAGPDPRGGTVQSNTLNFTIQADPAKVTASLRAKTVTYGAKDTISGQVTYQPQPGAAFQPAALEKWRSTARSTRIPRRSPAPPTRAATTASRCRPRRYHLDRENRRGGRDPLLADATATAPESVNVPTAITNFRTSLNQDWQLSYSGCLTSRAPDTGASKLPPPGLRLQYSYSQNGPWYALNVGDKLGGACGVNGVSFSGTTIAPRNYAYYRMYYPAPPDRTPQRPRFLPSTSGASLSWKYLDRITAFSLSPHSFPWRKLTIKDSCSTSTAPGTTTRSSSFTSSSGSKAAAPGMDRQDDDELHRPLQRYGQRRRGLRDMGRLVRGQLNPPVGGTARNLRASQVIARQKTMSGLMTSSSFLPEPSKARSISCRRGRVLSRSSYPPFVFGLGPALEL